MQKRSTVQVAESDDRRSRAATEAVAFDTLSVTKSVRNGSVPMGAPSSFAPSVSMGIAAQMPGCQNTKMG
jgi:hypothetical protein